MPAPAESSNSSSSVKYTRTTLMAIHDNGNLLADGSMHCGNICKI